MYFSNIWSSLMQIPDFLPVVDPTTRQQAQNQFIFTNFDAFQLIGTVDIHKTVDSTGILDSIGTN